MAVAVREIYQCPKCEEHIVAAIKPKNCPACKYEFPDASGMYLPPLTFHEQHTKYADKDSLYDAILNLRIEKAEAIMHDALYIIETVAGKICQPKDIRELMGLAKAVGDIAHAYETYLEAKGRHVPSLYTTTEETTNDTQREIGRDPTTSDEDVAGEMLVSDRAIGNPDSPE
jgi:hypothetical protein